MLKPRVVAFLALTIGATALFVRLGVWQLDRLEERRAFNRGLIAQVNAPEVPVAEVGGVESPRFRKVWASGEWDYGNELVLTSRSRKGSPGVYVLTPLKPTDGGDAVVVIRGWLYAANGMTVDLAPWRESDSATVHGYVETYTNETGQVSTPSAPRGVRRLDADSIAARLPYPILPVLLVQQDSAAVSKDDTHPVRLEQPELSEGSHKSYAFQWFSFAAITVIGTLVVLSRERRARFLSSSRDE